MTLPTQDYLYCTSDDIVSELSMDGQVGRVDDDSDGSISTPELAFVTRAINRATARCNYYLAARYATSDLAQSWIVNEWAAILASYWLSCRRGNPAAGSLKDRYDEAITDMKSVQMGENQLPEIGLRSAAWPAWSNVRVDIWYNLRKARVQRPLSEKRGGNPDYIQNRDVAADYIVEPN